MATKNLSVADAKADPFGEFPNKLQSKRLQLLGGRFQFEADHESLLQLVDSAYCGLPPHRFGAATPHFRIRLHLSSEETLGAKQALPLMKMHSGTGMLCGALDAGNFAALVLDTGAGLVTVSRRMLEKFPYEARYELLEFAVFTLASRVQRLVSLHAGCVGLHGNGLLLIGDSGAGKSTLTLHCLLRGLDFLAEDAIFVTPGTLLATGIANFLHVRRDSMRFLKGSAMAPKILNSPVIQRRSGIRKFEVDLRQTDHSLASKAQKISSVICLSKAGAENGSLLMPLSGAELAARLLATQPYAARRPEWPQFIKRISRIGGFELRRGRHPDEAVDVLCRLLE